ncbi:MAG: hypothetical protein GX256_09295 [Fretibacterium sp.]|nr:hypothetical protein [Fretibacterium sp.]
MDETFELRGGGVWGVIRQWRVRGLILAVVLCLLFSVTPSEGDEAADRVVLDAERVSYNDETGLASASGEAVLRHRDVTIRAERIDYDAVAQKVEALPLPGEAVVLQAADKHLKGDRLIYDLETREGVLTGARTNLAVGAGVLYVWGGNLDVVPWDMAVERGLVRGEKGRPDDYIAEWRDVILTTCALDHPHYRLESRRISFIPGRKVIAKRPRIYLGKTYLFTSPLDYVVQIERRALKYSMVPYLQNKTDHGLGVGLSGALAWDTGSLSLGFVLWSRLELEWMVELEQVLGGGFSVRVGGVYTWDAPWDEKIFRPSASLFYDWNGWRAAFNWTKDEYIQDQKDSFYRYEGRLDRRAELTVASPWIPDPVNSSSWFRFKAAWGSYREKTPVYEGDEVMRYGLELRSYFERPLADSVEFFWDITGGTWFYDRDSFDQEWLRFFGGLRYCIGPFELGTGYERRWVWGESAMFWDQLRAAEKLHQKIRFPLGPELFFVTRGAYDLNESRISEAIYGLQWVSDCMKWELSYCNDRSRGAEDKISLSMSLLAFPGTEASFGQDIEKDVFERPDGLAAKAEK